MKKTSVQDFLKEQRDSSNWKGGIKCKTCSHPKAKEINEEFRVFAQAKKDGHEMPWSRFIRDRLGEVYGVNWCHTAIMRHVRDCLRIR